MVKRCHTFPIIGEYTNAQHQYNATMLLMLLHPAPTMRLVRAVMTHDTPERWSGDPPASGKWLNPELAAQVELTEQRCAQRLGLDEQLTPEDVSWLQGVDKLELLMWSLEQQALGNRYAVKVESNLRSWYNIKADTLPAAIRRVWNDWRWDLLSDNVREFTDDAAA